MKTRATAVVIFICQFVLICGLGVLEHRDDNTMDVFAIRVSKGNEVFEMEASWKSSSIPEPPPHEAAAKMARYIVHYSDWTSIATLSTLPQLEGFPFANIISISDGATIREASGEPYFYLTPFDYTVEDLEKDNRASLTMTLAQNEYCRQKALDPEDPRCAHVILTGRIVKVAPNSREESFARKALFARHKAMRYWPTDHGWFFAKLEVSSVIVRDYFGGAADIPPKEYFQVKPPFY